VEKVFRDIATTLPNESTNKKKNGVALKKKEAETAAGYGGCASC
jgi:hypothetical protein